MKKKITTIKSGCPQSTLKSQKDFGTVIFSLCNSLKNTFPNVNSENSAYILKISY